MKQVICVGDYEIEYAYQLMAAVNGRKTCPFTMRAFSSPETLVDYLKREMGEILLLTPEFYTDEVRELKPENVFILTDGRDTDAKRTEPQIYKYQRADRLIRQVIAEYKERVNGTGGAGSTKVISIYSPLHRIGKTTFALAFGQELSEERRVLYLNFESSSGFSGIFSETYDQDLTDLLYFSQQEDVALATKLTSIVHRIHQMDYVPPAGVPLELLGVSEEAWLTLLQQLKKSSLYDVILLDLGDQIQGLPEILNQSDIVYMPVAHDLVAEGKLRQFEDMLNTLSYSELRERIRKIDLPQMDFVNGEAIYMGEFLWGPLSGYARGLITEELRC